MAGQGDENYKCPYYDCPGATPEGRSLDVCDKFAIYSNRKLDSIDHLEMKEIRIVHHPSQNKKAKCAWR